MTTDLGPAVSPELAAMIEAAAQAWVAANPPPAPTVEQAAVLRRVFSQLTARQPSEPYKASA